MGTSPSVPDASRARFEELFRAHHRELLWFAARRVGSAEAADVVSEVYVIAWRRLSEIPEQYARAWLFATARLVIKNEQRAQRRRDGLHQRAAEVWQDTVADTATAVADRVLVHTILAAMSGTDREVLRLAEWERLTEQEAALVLGCSRTAYKLRLHRARKRFTARLAKAMPGDDNATAGQVLLVEGSQT